MYKYVEPYVSNSPRAAYLNYIYLENVVNNNSYTQANPRQHLEFKYFNNNFNKLVRMKLKVDPGNFFKNEQSKTTFKYCVSFFTTELI